MIFTKNTKILIIGLGVIGGSYASALTQKGYTVKCITKEKKDIDFALNRGIISYGTTETDANLIADAELIIFALYPTVFIKWIKENQSLISPGTLITDVSGVKSGVLREVRAILRNDIEFVSTHPMAGRERSGVEFSDASVFKGANYIITPVEENKTWAIDVCKKLGEELGFAKISLITPEKHDEMIAFLSQLTHCIAVSLMNCNDTPELERYTGDSFRDLTRIAKINEKMWAELFLMNKDHLITQMDSFIEEFNNFKNMIKTDDTEGLMSKMKASTQKRALFDKPIA